MNKTLPNNWSQANQRHLMAAIGRVRSALERHAAQAQGKEVQSGQGQVQEKIPDGAAEALPVPMSLERLEAAFGLSPFERDILLMCAGVELDSAFAACCAAAQGDARRTHPTFSLAMAALPEAHWSALTPDAPLRRWRLIELANNDSLTVTPLRIDERVLHFLAGINEVDLRLRAIIESLSAPAGLPPSQLAVAGRIAEGLKVALAARKLPVIQLYGADKTSRQRVAAAACGKMGMLLHGIQHREIPAVAGERENLSRLWEREAIFTNSALLVHADESESAECVRSLLPFLEITRGVLFVSRNEPLPAASRTIMRFEVHQPIPAEQRILWKESLGEVFHRLNGQLENVIAQFNLGPGAIQSVSAELKSTPQDKNLIGDRFWEACRVQARARLDDLAPRLEPAAGWEDLVLPEAQRQILREIASHVRQRAKVYDSWDFASKGKRGLGISALFAGGSGTGKTMAAEVLARELELDLYRIDLSAVVSKYIGETEKNLRRLFDAAEESGSLLLFDEADALFGKRSEVKDSHDRYANIEVSYLLQRMEAYRGLAILTTNMKEALDPAFLRRIRFVVQFPFPDANQRAEIWRRIFPTGTPTEGLDSTKLGRLNVAGGNIRNIALNAAFLAADANEPVRMGHLQRAARAECVKIEKPLTSAEIGDWT